MTPEQISLFPESDDEGSAATVSWRRGYTVGDVSLRRVADWQKDIGVYYGDFNRGRPIVARGLAPLLPHHDVANFSPRFDWGNGFTPGARQLAVAMLKEQGLQDEDALLYHESFAKLVLADLGEHKWRLSDTDVQQVLDSLQAQRRPTSVA